MLSKPYELSGVDCITYKHFLQIYAKFVGTIQNIFLRFNINRYNLWERKTICVATNPNAGHAISEGYSGQIPLGVE